MPQNYNIYINDKVLILTSSIPDFNFAFEQIDVQGFDLKDFFYKSYLNNSKTYILLVNDPKSLWKKITNNIKIIKAAGGLVYNEDGDLLFIFRHNKWDLPKGKLEKGERKKDAAVREVEEECGITISNLGKRIGKTYHVYELKGQVILKVSYWYKMKSSKKQILIPQFEESITAVKWIAERNFKEVYENTFPSIKDILAQAKERANR